jgi:hypothetical protein
VLLLYLFGPMDKQDPQRLGGKEAYLPVLDEIYVRSGALPKDEAVEAANFSSARTRPIRSTTYCWDSCGDMPV